MNRYATKYFFNMKSYNLWLAIAVMATIDFGANITFSHGVELPYEHHWMLIAPSIRNGSQDFQVSLNSTN